MKLLFLDQFSDVGGAQRCLADLLPAIIERGWTVRVALPKEGPFSALLEKLAVPIDFLSCGPYASGHKTVLDAITFARDVRKQIKVISQWIAQHQPDLLYVNGPRLLPAATHAAGALPLIFHSHSFLSRWHDLFLTGRALRKRNVRVIASSRYVAKPLLKYTEAGRLDVIYNGTPEIPFRRRSFPQDGIWRIGVIGRVAPEKGQLEFVKAARLLNARQFPAQYFVHGAAVLASPEYFQSVREASVGLPISFTGWHDSIAAIINELDLIVVPSPAHESTTRVILEAYSAGTPVVASGAGGIQEIVRHGETGFVVPVVTPEALAAAIEHASGDPQGLASMALAARRRWDQEFRLARYQTQVMDVIEAAVRPMSERNNNADKRITAAAIPNTGP